MPASLTASVTADRAESLLPVLTACASKNERCPTNQELGKLIKARSEAVIIALQLLEEQGRIAVDRHSNYRVVTILATGQKTAMPVYKSRMKAPKVRATILPATTVKVLALVREAEAKDVRRPSETAMAETCGVSRNTISRALRSLEDDGTIDKLPPRPKAKRVRKRVARILPFRYADDWQEGMRIGSIELLKALQREHPERLAA